MGIGCLLNGADIKGDPIKTGVCDIASPGMPCQQMKQDGVIPEIKYTDGFRRVRILTDIGKPNNCAADPNAGKVEDFPFWGNN